MRKLLDRPNYKLLTAPHYSQYSLFHHLLHVQNLESAKIVIEMEPLNKWVLLETKSTYLSFKILSYLLYYRSPTKLREDNVFAGGGGHVWGWVGKWAVRILLECFLGCIYIFNILANGQCYIGEFYLV